MALSIVRPPAHRAGPPTTEDPARFAGVPARARLLLVCVAVVALASLVLVGAPAGATDHAVSTTADSGPGSLREAISLANASPGPDVITVPPGHYARTVAGGNEDDNATGDLDIIGDLTIIGTDGAAQTTIDAAGFDRVFEVRAGNVTLQGLTITGANLPPLTNGGGVFLRAGTLHLLDSVVAHNDAYDGAGVWASSGTLDIARTAFIDNTGISQPGNGSAGGALGTMAAVTTIADSLFHDNHAVAGNAGAIYGRNLITISNTTINANTAGRGAIDVEAGTDDTTVLTLSYVTISNNVATYGGNAGVITNATQNGTSEILLEGVLFHDNQGGSDANCAEQVNGVITSLGHNLSDDTTCPFLTDPTDLTDDHGTSLAALADNGGATRTRALGAGSSAIDAGGDCAAERPTDQRDAPRPSGGACDIGAFELGAVAPPVTLPTVPTTTSTTSTSTSTTSTTMPEDTTTTSTTMPEDTTTTSTTMPEDTTTTTEPESTTTTTEPGGGTDQTTTTSTTVAGDPTGSTTSTTAAPATDTTVTPTDPTDPTDPADAEVLSETATAAYGTTTQHGSLPVTGSDLRLALAGVVLLALGAFILSASSIILVGLRRSAARKAAGR